MSRPALLAAATSLLLAACGSMPDEATPDAAMVERLALAQEYEAQGRFRAAVLQWRAIELMSGDAAVTGNIRRLERLRVERAREWREDARRHLSNGRLKDAEQALRKAWVLTPGDANIRQQLMQWEKARLQRQMHAKVARSRKLMYGQNGTVEAAKPSSGETEYLANELTTRPTAPRVPATSQTPPSERVRSLLKTAEQRFEQADYAAALDILKQARESAGEDRQLIGIVQARQRAYADLLYGEGIRAAAADPERALELWRRTLEFDPAHARAVLRVRSAGSES